MEETAKMDITPTQPENKEEIVLPGSTTDQNVPWCSQEIGSQLTPATRSLLENYSNIPSSEIEVHIYSIVSPPPPLVQNPKKYSSI